MNLQDLILRPGKLNTNSMLKNNASMVPQKQPTADLEMLGADASLPEDILEQLELMHPAERREFMDELAVHSEFWDEEGWL